MTYDDIIRLYNREATKMAAKNQGDEEEESRNGWVLFKIIALSLSGLIIFVSVVCYLEFIL